MFELLRYGLTNIMRILMAFLRIVEKARLKYIHICILIQEHKATVVNLIEVPEHSLKQFTDLKVSTIILDEMDKHPHMKGQYIVMGNVPIHT
ncbi:hypothetical protein CLU79DRAFT_850890, partial [Phycomyces nitens]